MAALTGWDAHELTTAAGTRMHAAVRGPVGAPEIICVPGLGCSHRYYLPLARRLAPAARVVAVDLPGFGRTPAPARALDIRGLSRAFADWLAATGRGGSLVVANSVGCQVAVDLAMHSPDLLGPLVLTGPTMDGAARSVLHQTLRLLRDAPRERPTLSLVVARDYLRCGPRRFFATLRYALADPVERKLRHVRVPTLVVRGGRDPVVTRHWATRVAALLPQGRYAEVPGAPHALNFSAADALARLVRSLLPAAQRSVG